MSCIVFISFCACFAAAIVGVLASVMVWEHRCLGLIDGCVGLRLGISVIYRVAGLSFSSIFAVEVDAIDG